MSPITTHVLDTATGAPAAGVPIRLELARGDTWELVGSGQTNSDGRLPGLMDEGALQAARYRITFDTGTYLAKQQRPGFYPYVEVVFEITDPEAHHHVPLLLSPFGYSTYRGS